MYQFQRHDPGFGKADRPGAKLLPSWGDSWNFGRMSALALPRPRPRWDVNVSSVHLARLVPAQPTDARAARKTRLTSVAWGSAIFLSSNWNLARFSNAGFPIIAFSGVLLAVQKQRFRATPTPAPETRHTSRRSQCRLCGSGPAPAWFFQLYFAVLHLMEILIAFLNFKNNFESGYSLIVVSNWRHSTNRAATATNPTGHWLPSSWSTTWATEAAYRRFWTSSFRPSNPTSIRRIVASKRERFLLQ